MHHWSQVLPIKIMNVRYETFIADAESESKKLIEYLSLDWNEACLQFYNSKRTVRTLSTAQVRRPIYKQSQQRWRNYSANIKPLMDIVGEDEE